MAFWSSEKYIDLAADGEIVDPFDTANIKHCAYELAVGGEAYISSVEGKQLIAPGMHITIPPGQFALLLTEETVSIPLDVIGFISIRASIKFRGLVNVSGFHIDPGFKGRLKFSVYNAGGQPIVLARGQRIFMMWLSDLDRKTRDGYKSTDKWKNEISSEDVQRLIGEVVSPAALKMEISELETNFEKKYSALEKEVHLWRGVMFSVLILLIGLILKDIIVPSLNSTAGTNSPQATTMPAATPPLPPMPAAQQPAPATPPSSSSNSGQTTPTQQP
jgi:dCTP deaminase